MNSSEKLKKQAESRLPGTGVNEVTGPLSAEESAALIHELKVHQIELEIQNEELRRAEIGLLISRDRYRHLFDDAPVGYLVLNASTLIMEANETFCRLAGRSSDEVSGLSFAQFLVPGDRNSFLSRFRAWLVQPQGKALEVSLLTRDGASRPVQLGGVSSGHAHDEKENHLLLSLTDISASHRLRQEIETVNRERELLIETIPVGVYKYRMIKAGGFRFDYVSQLWCQQLGLDREEVLKDAAIAFTTLHPDDQKDFLAANETARSAMRPFSWEGRFVVNRQIRWLRLRSTPERLPNDDILWNGVQEDITEAKRLEAERQAARDILQKIADRVPGVVFQFRQHPDGRVSLPYASNALRDIYGFEPGAVRDDATPIFAVVHPDDRAKHLASINASAASLSPWHNEYRLQREDRPTLWLLGNALPEREADGSIIWHGLVTDITARKAAEQALADFHRDFEAFLNQTTDFVYFKDRDSRFRFCSQTLARITGHRDWHDMIGKHDREVFPSDTAQIYEDEEAPIFAEGKPLLNKIDPYYDADGQPGYVLTSKWPLRNAKGAVAGIFGISRDISERMALERSLRDREAFFRNIAEVSPSGIWRTDTQGNYLYVSAVWSNITGLPAEAAMGKGWSVALHPEDRARVFQEWTEATRDSPPLKTYRSEFRFQRPDGSVVSVLSLGVPDIDASHQVTGWTGTITDLTEQKRLMGQLFASNTELEQFSYSISHDMRQPLRMITSYLQLLQTRLGESLDAEKSEYFNFAIDGAKRLDTMLMGLLEYSRIGRKGEPPVWIDSRLVLDEVLQILNAPIDQMRATIRIAGEWPHLLASPDEIFRLLQNLISNALKFQLAGQLPEIVLTSQIVNQCWHLCISDNGVGIQPDQIGRLFQVFQRLQSRADYEGTGLGLALCRKFVEHHGGRIWVESAGQNQGSQFHVEIPLSAEATT